MTTQASPEPKKCRARIEEGDPSSKQCTLSEGHPFCRHEHWRDGQLLAAWVSPEWYRQPSPTPTREQRLEDALREVADLLEFHEGSGVATGAIDNRVVVVNEEDWNTALRVARAALEKP